MKRNTKAVLDKRVLQELSKRTSLPWLRDVTLDWIVIAGACAATYAFPNFLVGFLALLVIGNRQHALTILGHDGTHQTLSLNKRYNDFLTNFFCFWPLGLTVSGYRSLHWKHHRHTGTLDDPELMHKLSRSPQWDLPAKISSILKFAALDVLGSSIPDYKIIVTYSKPDKTSDYIPLTLMHVVLASTLIYSGLWLAALLWYGSLLTTFMMWFRLRLWLEHQGTPETHRLHLNLWQGALLAPHNSWMHWEHHNWPSVPYHRLSKIREIFNDVPVMSLRDLIEFLKNSPPIPSGHVMN